MIEIISVGNTVAPHAIISSAVSEHTRTRLDFIFVFVNRNLP